MYFYWFPSTKFKFFYPKCREGATMTYCGGDYIYLYGGRSGEYVKTMDIYDYGIIFLSVFL